MSLKVRAQRFGTLLLQISHLQCGFEKADGLGLHAMILCRNIDYCADEHRTKKDPWSTLELSLVVIPKAMAMAVLESGRC